MNSINLSKVAAYYSSSASNANTVPLLQPCGLPEQDPSLYCRNPPLQSPHKHAEFHKHPARYVLSMMKANGLLTYGKHILHFTNKEKLYPSPCRSVSRSIFRQGEVARQLPVLGVLRSYKGRAPVIIREQAAPSNYNLGNLCRLCGSFPVGKARLQHHVSC